MTTTFADIELTEDVDYHFEHEKYSWEKGDVISLPRHTARKFVHNWDKANWGEKTGYEVRDEEYDEVAARVRNQEKEDFDPQKDTTNKEYLDNSTVGDVEQKIDEILESGINKESTAEDDILYLKDLRKAEENNQNRKGVKTAIEEAIKKLEKGADY